MRCLALADALVGLGWDCQFAITRTTFEFVQRLTDYPQSCCLVPNELVAQPAHMLASFGGQSLDLLVIDHYGWNGKLEHHCRDIANKILVIDDLADRQHDSDFLLDQNLGRYARDYKGLLPSECKVLVGPKYALLRPQFHALRKKTLTNRLIRKRVDRVLISFGLSDTHELILKTLHALKNLGFDGCIDLVLAANSTNLSKIEGLGAMVPGHLRVHAEVQDMAFLMARADIAIGGGGTTCWERCALGLPTVIIVVAQNQTSIAKGLANAGAAWVVGSNLDVTSDDIARGVHALISDDSRRHSMSCAASKICDAAGCEHVLRELGL